MTSETLTNSAARDEMVDGRRGLRPHWRGLLGALTALGEGGLAARAYRLNRAFEEEGVTSVLPGASAAHLWRCDPIPLPIPAAEFAELETGLAQRAALLEAILGDLYGPQTLLTEGALPPALVYPNPGFLRSSCGAHAGPRLQLYAADLVRGPDGAWRVLADHTAGADGLGYARENRRLLARVVPEAFRTLQMRSLRPFFDMWQDALQRLAPAGKSNPAVALLTPGTAHPHWFEHMYLSRELSCALVEPGDLTVRGGALFLKTLKGLQQVDVLVRRLDGRLIDPLECESGSLIGMPGLLDAMRGGAVRVVNDPGAGVVEAPALATFLPRLCLRLLDQRLQIASVPTMWLGEERARKILRDAPERWMLRPALDGTEHATGTDGLDGPEIAAFLARIERRPWEWAARGPIPHSVAPCLGENGMTPKPVVLRMFLVFDGQAWRTMPGGLARVVEPADLRAGQMPRGGITKDVWVLTDERADIVGPRAVVLPPLRLRRTSGDLPSRIADDLFWLGRYVEQIERAARLVRAAVTRLARGTAMLPTELVELQALASCLGEAEMISEEEARRPTPTTLSGALLLAARETGALGRKFARIARLTDAVRDRLTGDMYATFTQTLRGARADTFAAARSPDGRDLDELAHAMVSIMRFSNAVAGVAAENMVRGGGWLFLELGRRIERAQAVATEVGFALDQPPSRIEVALQLVLELCDSNITYRSRYLNVLQAAPVLDLVLADQGNPRGLAFQLAQMHTLLDELTGEAPRELLAGTAAGLLVEIEALVDGVLAAPNQPVAASALPERLHEVARGVEALSDRINRRYFALLPAAQAVGVSADPRELRGAA